MGYTLNTIQAIVLLESCRRSTNGTVKRQAAARFYADAMADMEALRLPPEPNGSG